MASGSRGSHGKPPAPGGDPSEDWDVNSLLAEPLPNAKARGDQPDWLAQEEKVENPFDTKDEWGELDVAKMRRERLAREKADSFGERLKRGELRADDIPDTGLGTVFVGVVHLALKPVYLVTENFGMLAVAAGIMVLFMLVSGVMSAGIHWFF